MEACIGFTQHDWLMGHYFLAKNISSEAMWGPVLLWWAEQRPCACRCDVSVVARAEGAVTAAAWSGRRQLVSRSLTSTPLATPEKRSNAPCISSAWDPHLHIMVSQWPYLPTVKSQLRHHCLWDFCWSRDKVTVPQVRRRTQEAHHKQRWRAVKNQCTHTNRLNKKDCGQDLR